MATAGQMADYNKRLQELLMFGSLCRDMPNNLFRQVLAWKNAQTAEEMGIETLLAEEATKDGQFLLPRHPDAVHNQMVK